MKAPFVRNPYNYDLDEASDFSGLKCDDPSLTRQSEALDADINTIARRYGLGAELPPAMSVDESGNLVVPWGEADFSDAPVSYEQALSLVQAGGDMFMRYPAEVRARFNNNPHEFLTFIHDPRNVDEAIKLGLAERRIVNVDANLDGKGPSKVEEPAKPS